MLAQVEGISMSSHSASPIATELHASGLFMKEDDMNRLEKVLYTARVHTTGGRTGMSRSSDGRLEVTLSRPGSAGTGTNPEQLFAPAGPRASSRRWSSLREA